MWHGRTRGNFDVTGDALSGMRSFSKNYLKSPKIIVQSLIHSLTFQFDQYNLIYFDDFSI